MFRISTKRIAFIVLCVGIGICLAVFIRQREKNRENAGDPSPAEEASRPIPVAAPESRDTITKETYFPDGRLRTRAGYHNDRLHGTFMAWYTNGQLQVREEFVNGVSHGTRTKWYSSGLRKSEAQIVEGQIHGGYTTWNKDGTVANRASFRAGKPHGVSTSYYPSGFIKAVVTAEEGEVLAREQWADGEYRVSP